MQIICAVNLLKICYIFDNSMHMQVVTFNFTYADNNEKSGRYDAKKDTIWRHTMLFHHYK